MNILQAIDAQQRQRAATPALDVQEAQLRCLFTHRTVYGNELYYPKSPAAQALCDLKGSKTLLLHQIKSLQDVGFPIIIHRS